MDKTPRISITIIGHNEGYHLSELLPTLDWADEIIYVDCKSDDDSLRIAQAAGCLVFQKPNNPNLNVNKDFAMKQAGSDWLFYLDPDERIPAELAAEIRSRVSSPDKYQAFSLNRRNHYFGKWLKHGSQYPDTQLRLFRKESAQFPLKHVHEKLQVDGPVGKLKNDMHHHPYLNISQYLQKFDFYTSFEANYLSARGERPSPGMSFHYWISQPALRFVRRYFFKQGFLDGWQGFFAALFDSLNFMVRYFKLIEITRQQAKDEQKQI
ncbi:MAG: glycosyltransferase family 2 protein [Calditrichia bacterium]